MNKLLAKRRRLFISFSGGKTSAYMLVRLLREHAHEWGEIVVLFANTGEEHEKTLIYVDRIAKHYGVNVVWVEAVVNAQRGTATTHKVVTFETASRKGEPFEAVIAKYGIPNQAFSHCTRETKLAPMKSYIKALGWEKGSFDVAVGIRYDELDRVSPKSMEDGVIYPLIDLKVRKEDVLAWDLASPVRLGLAEHYGNCVTCWKKSLRKLGTIAREEPSAFAFFRRMERDHAHSGAGVGPRRFFRKSRTTDDIFKLATDSSFEPFVDTFHFKDEELDLGSSCGESCEIGTDNAFDEGLSYNPADLI